MRFLQTLVFGRFRLIFRNLGRCFVEQGLLDSIDDVYYLELSEVLGFVEGNTSCGRLRELAQIRKQEVEHHSTLEESPGSFVTQSSPFLDNIQLSIDKDSEHDGGFNNGEDAAMGDVRRGLS